MLLRQNKNHKEECPMTFFNTYTTKFNTYTIKLAGAFFARSRILLAIAGILLLSLLFACHKVYGGQEAGDTYSVGATVKGHTGEVSLTLIYGNDDKTETLKVPIDAENFTFDAKLGANQSFALNVIAPAGQTCSPSLAGGVIIDADVTDIEVTCEAVYSVGATVVGLAEGDSITLTLTPTDGTAEDKTITGDVDATTDDAFAFDTKLVAGTTYTVTTNSPMNKICTVDNAGTQTIAAADANITVTCVAVYSVSGWVIGAADNSQITITLLHADPPNSAPVNPATIDVTPNADGTFSIAGVPEDKIYLLSVDSATANEGCIPNALTFSAPITNNAVGLQITCSIPPPATYSIGGAVSGLADGEIITLTLTPTGDTVENKVITADADATTTDTFTFDKKLIDGATYTVTITTVPNDKACTVNNAGTQTVAGADVTDITVTCIVAYSISGSVVGAIDSVDIYVVLIVYDDNTGTGGTRQHVVPNATGTFYFADIPENKFYTLQAASRNYGETCSGPSTTPVQVTADVTGALVTCMTSTHAGSFLRIELFSFAYEASLTTFNVFIGDGAIPDTSGTPTQVIRGTDADVVIIPNIDNLPFENIFYDISMDAGKYYAITATTSGNETCTVQNGTGGPVTNNLGASILCQ